MRFAVYEILRRLKNWLIEFSLSGKEFISSRKNTRGSKQTCLESGILVLAHSLEKGMGLRETREGYGIEKAQKLLNYLKRYLDCGYDVNAFPFAEAVCIVEKYLEFQKMRNINVSKLSKQYTDLFSQINNVDGFTRLNAGYETLSSETLKKAENFKFEEFLRLRHSIRSFSEKQVSEDIITQAVKIANMSPTACNRQPQKVYCTVTKESGEYIDSLITGTAGFKGSIPNFAIVTVDRAYFSGAEYLQWYINGGIYVSFLTLAFHSLGIGSCIMQWFAFYKTEKKIKEYFKMSKTEAIIAVIGFGYYADKVKCICAQRKDVCETVSLK